MTMLHWNRFGSNDKEELLPNTMMMMLCFNFCQAFLWCCTTPSSHSLHPEAMMMMMLHCHSSHLNVLFFVYLPEATSSHLIVLFFAYFLHHQELLPEATTMRNHFWKQQQWGTTSRSNDARSHNAALLPTSSHLIVLFFPNCFLWCCTTPSSHLLHPEAMTMTMLCHHLLTFDCFLFWSNDKELLLEAMMMMLSRHLLTFDYFLFCLFFTLPGTALGSNHDDNALPPLPRIWLFSLNLFYISRNCFWKQPRWQCCATHLLTFDCFIFSLCWQAVFSGVTAFISPCCAMPSSH